MTRQYTYELCCLVVGMLFICSTVHEVDSFSLRMMSSSSTTTTMPGTGKTAVIAGASGYIGKSVVRESVRQGFKTIALVRDKEKITSKQGEAMYGQFFEGADVVECDVTNPDQLTKVRTQNQVNIEERFYKRRSRRKTIIVVTLLIRQIRISLQFEILKKQNESFFFSILSLHDRSEFYDIDFRKD